MLKAAVSEAGEGWSDSRIIKALETSVSMVYRVRKQLVEKGFEAVLSRKSELAVLTSQCLDRRIPDKQTLIDEVAAWEQERNANHTKANWHFTTSNARVKLSHLYPSI